MDIKPITLIAVLLFSAIYIFGQDTLNRIDAQGKKIGYWKKYEGKTLVYEGRFNKDVPMGEFKYYHEDGSLKSISKFLNGTHKVQSTLYHRNGQKSAEGLFVDQQKDGEWKYYSNAGKLIKQENYKKGVSQGEWKTFSTQTGNLLIEESFDSGLLNGVRKEYYISGNIKSITPYIAGKRNGIAESYLTDNKLESRGMFHNDGVIGVWDFFDENGKLRKQIEYEKGREKSTAIVFYNGNMPQKLNQTTILFIQKLEDGIAVTTRTGNKIKFFDDFGMVKFFVDPLVIVQVNPSIMVAFDAIKGYKEVEDDENEIIVIVEPAFEFEIIARDDFALLIKSFCNTTVPVEE